MWTSGLLDYRILGDVPRSYRTFFPMQHRIVQQHCSNIVGIFYAIWVLYYSNFDITFKTCPILSNQSREINPTSKTLLLYSNSFYLTMFSFTDRLFFNSRNLRTRNGKNSTYNAHL